MSGRTLYTVVEVKEVAATRVFNIPGGLKGAFGWSLGGLPIVFFGGSGVALTSSVVVKLPPFSLPLASVSLCLFWLDA